jgi:hypothetical protein
MKWLRLAVAGACISAALALPAHGQLPAFGPCERTAESAPEGAPVDVQLDTVTDTAAVLTWLTCSSTQPFATDSTVEYSLLAGGNASTVTAQPDTAFHYVRIDGLKPGHDYRYSVSSNGVPTAPGRLNPGVFTTLTPPPGKELFSFAVLADTHLGETTSGLATGDFPPGYSSDTPYSQSMLDAAVANINAKRIRFSLVAADLTSHGELDDMTTAKTLLDRLHGDYLVTRGSHDRPGQYEEAKSECGPDGDCFRKIFRPDLTAGDEPQHSTQATTYKKWSFISLDSADLASGNGVMPNDELDWLKDQLEAAKKHGRPSVIFFHHPVAEYSTTLAVPPVTFGVEAEQAQNFLKLIADYDVRLVVNAHTHRNWIAYSPNTGAMPIIEVGPAKEYPAGYTVIRVFSGGLLREWWPIECDFCNEWRETTRGEYFDLYPYYTEGSLRDRSFVHLFDGADRPGVPSVPAGVWPALGPREA